jgi:mRNA deadenylase 3'-5' endonuclease subunit Ccr4
VLTYNVLASYSAKPQYFHNAKVEHLNHLHRWRRILAEIDHHDADVLCLQEVDLYQEFWKPHLEERGYRVLYTKRTGFKTDGELVAFRHSRFYVSDQRVIAYNDLIGMTPGSEESRAQFATDNTSIAAVLTPLEEDLSAAPACARAHIGEQKDQRADPANAYTGLPSLLVASVHLFWHPDYTHVRLAQTRYLLRTLAEIADEQPMHVRDRLATVLVGDFNTSYDTPSYRCVVNAHQRAGGFSLGPLVSAYASREGTADAPYSSMTHGKNPRDRLVDYLFFSSTHLQQESRLGLPSFDRLAAAYAAFPNESYGSDHLCLGASFSARPVRAVE